MRRAGVLRGAWARLRRLLRPPRILRPTRAGWCFFAIVLGVGFAALNTGNNLLYLVLSLLLSFLVLSGLFSESALRGVRIRRRLPRELYAEHDNAVWLEIHNGQRRVPSFALVIEDLLDAGPDVVEPVGRSFALRVGPGESELRRYALRPERRGPLALRGFRVSTRFPFGLFHKARIVELPAELLVFPAIDPMAAEPPEADGAECGALDRHALGGGLEVAGLREHQPSDGVRRIHWRSSLRRGELLVRETEDERRSEVEVRLEGRTTGSFEREVRHAASQVVAYLEAGLRVALTTPAERFEADTGAAQRIRLLSHLARLPAPEGPA